MNSCPFKLGETVIYKPSIRGHNLDVMSDPEGRLVPGEKYRIAAIKKNLYVLVEGYNHPGGGIYWTEFASTDAA